MGGGIKTVTANRNIGNAINDLDTVYCSVDLIFGNNALFDRSFLFKKFNKEAAKYLKDNGIKYKMEGPAQLGGGGEGLLAFLKVLWANKAIFTMAIVLLKWIFNLVIAPKFDEKPRATVCLSLKTASGLTYVENSALEAVLIGRLINLKNLNDGLCDELQKKYPIFNFDQLVRVTLSDRSFRAGYTLLHEQRNAFNRFRLMRLFKGLKVRRGTDRDYIFNKLQLIERTDRETTHQNGAWMSSNESKRYFLFLSASVIKDYLK